MIRTKLAKLFAGASLVMGLSGLGMVSSPTTAHAQSPSCTRGSSVPSAAYGYIASTATIAVSASP